MDLQSIMSSCSEIAKEVGAFIRDEQKKIGEQLVQTKDLNSLVTYVDQEAEKRIVVGLKEIIPEASFIAEEGTEEERKSEFQWIVDPLDGTTNYIHQIPAFAVSIALAKGNELLVGVVYEVNRDECFAAFRGGGAFLNRQKIAVSTRGEFSDTLIATGFPYYDFTKSEAHLKVMHGLFDSCRGIRRMGSAAVDLCYVACGRFDAFFEYSLNPWDVAGGALIVQEAGGLLSDFSGGDNYLFGKEIIAGSQMAMPEMQSRIKVHFG